jgi:hypothetical protein
MSDETGGWMDAPSGGYREIAVPASIFATLRRELGKETGVLPTIHALHASGYAAGAAAAAAFKVSPDEDVRALSQTAFWTRVGAFFTRRGWGTLTHVPRHRAIGLLHSPDWAEGSQPRDEDDASCSFSSGFLSGLLTELAGGPVAVLEVTCRARGEEACSFAFGAASAIHDLYGHLLEGADLDTALGAL